MIFKNPEDALDYLFKSTDYEKMSRVRYNLTTFDLSRVRRLLGGIGNPERELTCAHITGTKGKSSTAEMLARIAMGAGAKVGLFTSPHLVNFTERIRIGGDEISKTALHILIEKIYPVRERMRREGKQTAPTFFETLTAMAFLYFREKRVDLAVLEVGLGGRIDSTNVVQPVVSAVTVIDFDHVEQLGNTLSKIAFEKAGIIKPGTPVVVASQKEEARAVILEEAKKKSAPVMEIGRDVSVIDEGRDRFSIRTKKAHYKNLTLNLIGEFQRENAAVAVVMAEVLKGEGVLQFDQQLVKQALSGVRLPGRIELAHRRPTVIIDGAHNPVSARALRRAIDSKIHFEKLILIIGMASDKDVDGILREILRGPSAVRRIICTTTGNPRAIAPHQLARKAEARGESDVLVAKSPGEAFKKSLAVAGKDDLILVTGSFYLAGEIKKLIQGLHP